MEAYEKVYRNRKRMFVDNLIGGIAWGLGATVGLAIILALTGFIFGKVGLVPVIGDFIANVNEYILQNHPQLIR